MRLNDMRLLSRGRSGLVVGLALFAGCANQGTSQTYDGTGGKDAGAPSDDGGSPDTSSPSGDDDAGTADVGGGNEVDSAVPQTPVSLPFNVSDQFIPSGFMGMMDGLKLSNATADCKTPRQAGAQGDCYKITWDITVPDGGTGWTGIFWQSPANNWGGKPGKLIASGAAKVSFYAAGAVGGEQIQFTIGGINTKGDDPTLPYKDKFTITSPTVTLTTDWAPYEVSLAGATYDEVLGGFSWVATTTTGGNVTFYLDNVHWE